MEKCFNKDKVNQFIVLPPVSSEIEYEKAIMKIIKDYNVVAIFPGSEPELKYFVTNREKYDDLFISINSKEIINLCLNKFETYKRFEELGFNVPRYKKINSVADCTEINFFPAVLKPNTNAGGSSHIYVAFNSEEASMFSKYMLGYGIDVIAQQYVGDGNGEYTIGVSSNSDGIVQGSVILKRNLNSGISVNKKMTSENRSVIISSGISQGEFVHDESLKKQAEEIAYKLNSKGPINIQGRVVEGKFLIFEINPRLSGTTYLRALVGYNEPENMIKSYILKQKVQYEYEDKTVLRSLQEKIM